jgi:squalene-hopene/tetraprenyl-beta-curcumene cyclase
LLHAGEAAHPAVDRGIQFLLSTQNAEGFWDEAVFTGTGFQRVFYLRYHGYCAFFPIWALALYRRSLAETDGGHRSSVVPLRFSGLPR